MLTGPALGAAPGAAVLIPRSRPDRTFPAKFQPPGGPGKTAAGRGRAPWLGTRSAGWLLMMLYGSVPAGRRPEPPSHRVAGPPRAGDQPRDQLSARSPSALSR